MKWVQWIVNAVQARPEDRPKPGRVIVPRAEDSIRDYPSSGLTPSRLASILAEADGGSLSTAMQLFEEMEGDTVFVLPSTYRKGTALRPATLSRGIKKNLDHFGIQPFTPHDLRRTASTMMSKLGVSRPHLKKVLSHSDGGKDVTDIYDRYEYWEEKKVALDTWSDYLRQIIAGKSKVTPIRKKAR